LRSRTNAHHIGVANRLQQFRFRQGFLLIVYVAIAIGLKRLDRAGMNAFQQQNLDLAFVQ
jgi:hypothetical protein